MGSLVASQPRPGRIWEAIHARRERRQPLDLYHTALVVRVPEGR